MTTWQHFVVVIADPFAKRQMAIRKAALLAQRCGAQVTLFHAFSLPYPLPSPAPADGAEALRAATRFRLKALVQLARPLHKAGIAVDCVVEWDFPAHDAINRFVGRIKPDLLIAESHRHGVIGRWLLANTDWELIRGCPCPLWFVKTRSLPDTLTILAAVDPLHAHAKPAQLDDRLINTALSLGNVINGTVLLAHAYVAPVSASAATFMEPLRIPISPDRAKRFVAGIRQELDQLAQRHAIPAARCLLKEGDPVSAISDLTVKRKADVLVMGAVSRSGLQRPFIGSTAEKLIDKVRCDLLIIKPAGFKSSVPKRSACERLKV